MLGIPAGNFWGDGEMGRWRDGEMGRWGTGNREQGIGNRQEARGKRQEARGKKSCLPHYYENCYR
ncbi:MAG: hypothetical protein F6K26_42240 [Moorea sp. SIO2I5]|nr:hypothetical protein [Moorena sp. SIO2I5]